MMKIWEEKLVALKVIDTGLLLRSVRGISTTRTDADCKSAFFELGFRTYGLFQNWGTGREVPRGNPGDIGRPKVRRPRRWFDKKFYGSSMNIRDFFADSLGREFLGIVSNAFSDKQLRQEITR